MDRQGKLRRQGGEGYHGVPQLIMDAAFWIHLPKLVIWCCFEFCIIFLAAAYPDNFDFSIEKSTTNGQPTDSYQCYELHYTCKGGLAYKILTSLWIGFLFLYMFIIQAYIRQTRQRLLLAPYKDYISVHLMVLRLRSQFLYLMFLGVVMVPILWFTRWQRCNNYFVAWLGLLPLQVIATSIVFMNGFYFMPMRPGDASIQQAWLQEFAWLESSVDDAVKKRAAHNPSKAAALQAEPIFCFESAIKLLLWSELVYYDFEADSKRELVEEKAPPKAASSCFQCCVADSSKEDELPNEALPIEGDGGLKVEAAGNVPDTPFDKDALEKPMEKQLDCQALLRVAMEMYDLPEFEVIHEALLETRVLIAWSSQVAVVAFRGTAGMANVRSDAKAWRTPHPPVRGKWYLGTQPLVHKGFLETWRVNNLDRRVIDRIKGIVDAAAVVPEEFRIYLTGHSLGGALATLAAIDLQRCFSFPQLHVYTYGAPRTGNHAFAREYEALVPHTWHLINDRMGIRDIQGMLLCRDAVPRSGKFWVMYKRPGQRTLINQVGDMRVRPAVLEVSIHTSEFGRLQHRMG